MKLGTLATFIFLLVLKGLAQDLERHNSLWGKLGLAQNFPNPALPGEIITIKYKAKDAQDVSIALYDVNGKKLCVYEDLYPGNGQIRIKKQLESGKYTYALFVNGRLVEKRVMEVVKDQAISLNNTKPDH